MFATPPPVFLPTYLVPYANDVFTALQAEAEEGVEDEAEADAEGEDHRDREQPGPTEPSAQDQSPTINLEATEDEFSNLSPLV